MIRVTIFLLFCVTVVPGSSLREQCAVRFQDNDVCACNTARAHDRDLPVKCTKYGIESDPCYCVYFDQQLNRTVWGECFYTCYEHASTFVEVTNSTQFNDDFCVADNTSIHRAGFFCYECNSTYGMAPYSSLLISCVSCQDYGFKNWIIVLSRVLLPLTVLYIVAVLLSFNITSSSLSGIVVVIQCIRSSPLDTGIYIFEGSARDAGYSGFEVAIITVLDLFNLEFFQLLYSPLCLHPKLNVFHVLCLDYVVALYPFLLIFVTYVLITAYDKQYRLLVWMWRPFKKCTHLYQTAWNINTSLIEIFASFILLSSVKLLRVSFSILLLIEPLYDTMGNKLYTIVFMSANVRYFSAQHLPYALLAIFMGLIFFSLPLLLLLYPSSCFHKCLNCCKLRPQSLHIFMDAFQGSYKTHPRDMRYFSAYYILLRIFMLMHASLFLSQQTLYISGILSFASAALIMLLQPFKVRAHNRIDSVLMLLMGVYFISCNEARLLASTSSGHAWTFSSLLQGLSLLVIILYFIGLVTWKLMTRSIRCIKERKGYTSMDSSSSSYHDVIETFERDVVTSNESSSSYPPLLETQQSTY